MSFSVQFTRVLAASVFLSAFCGLALAQISRKPSPTREPAGAMSKRPDSAKNALPRIASQTDFDSIARVYHQGTPYAMPHTMFVIDRRNNNKIYFVNSQKFRFHKDFLLATYLVPRGSDVFKPIYIDQDRRFIAGTIAFNEASSKYSEDPDAKFSSPFLTGRDGSYYVTIDLLDKEMVGMISKMKVGDFSQPTAFTSDQGKKGVRIVYLKSRSEPHRMNMQDDYSKISQMALEEKKSLAMEKWMKTKIPTYYIMVDEQTGADCPQLLKLTGELKAF